MAANDDHAPAWLFSFVDLSFLLLIAMTQVGSHGRGLSLELGQIAVPRVGAPATEALPVGAPDRWQLRIYPPDPVATSPFELSPPTGQGGANGRRIPLGALRERLAGLHAAGAARPLLAPHADSRSQDLLEGAELIEALWPGRRRATVAPVFDLR